MSKKKVTDQVSKNYEHFKKMLPTIINVHRNKYALMRDEEVVNYYTTVEDAVSTAQKFYPDGRYSIQKVTDEVVDLGFFSHAIPSR
ncbi:MAG: hypothetical protein IIB62_01010 [Proteobacteria bacterium]|nr:hypothetical protein [Pseudomonadota bacterium]